MSPHRQAELRSLALHAHVAAELDPSMVQRARARVEAWSSDGRLHPIYAERWRTWLALPLDELRAALVEDSERAHDLRQTSPFAGEIPARTRWEILRSLEPRSSP